MLKSLGALFCVTLLHVGAAHAGSAMRGYTCAQVRKAVVRYGGPDNAEALASPT